MPSTSTMTGVLTEEQFLSQVNQYNDALNSLVTNANDKINPSLPSELWELSDEELSQLYGKRVKKINNGSGYARMYAVESEPYYGASNPINSNTTTVNRGVIRQPINTTKSPTTGKAIFSNVAKAGKNLKFFAGSVASAATAASVGIWLGKTIDSTLYNANPNFWDSIGMSSLDPETWGNITNGDDSLGSQLFNFVFGIDPNTGQAQAYIDSNAAAYLSMCLQQAGIFDAAGKYIDSYEPVGIGTYANYPPPIPFVEMSGTVDFSDGSRVWHLNVSDNSSPVYLVYARGRTAPINVNMGYPYLYSESTFRYSFTPNASPSWSNSVSVTLVNGETAYYRNPGIPVIGGIPLYQSNTNTLNDGALGYTVLKGNKVEQQAIEGIGTQENAVLPDFTGLQTLQDYDNYLRQRYPDTYTDSVPITYLDENGDEQTTEYIPVPFPNISNYTDTKPVSDEATQTAVQQLTQQLTQLLQQRTTPTNTANPTDTGEGTPSPIVAPTGSASSLWSVYHPTQAQIDSFGAWLWSPSFIDQIAKIFNNPMESIIGLHKVYATPIDAGTSTIHVGYLDSGVSSAYVTQQYVEVDCGTVNLSEQFGNVMDYSPFTSVQLYLPFIGIVPLSIDDVMRADISVTYGVDIFTGACLAMVDVQRDMGGGVLYQYSGNCGVQYPISSGSYMGIVAGIASIAGGVVATIATGGGAAPALLGAAGAAMSMHTDVQHSGSFSGNSGAMGGKVPYLIISRPQSAMYGYEEVIEGLPANAYTTIGQCTGFVKARNVELVGVTATEDELSEIESLLLNGVYV